MPVPAEPPSPAGALPAATHGKFLPPPGAAVPQAAPRTAQAPALTALPDDTAPGDLAPIGAAPDLAGGAVPDHAMPFANWAENAAAPREASANVPAIAVAMASQVAPVPAATPALPASGGPGAIPARMAASLPAAAAHFSGAAPDAGSEAEGDLVRDTASAVDAPAGSGRTAASLAPGAGAVPPAASPAASPAAPVQLPGVAAPALALAPSPAMVSEAGAAQGAGGAPLVSGLENALEHVAGLRDAARSARPELVLRHGEFGAVSLKIEASTPGEWRAMLASRDPGFVPAVHAALAERAVAAASEAGGAGSGWQQGGHNGGRSTDGPGAGPHTGQPSYGSSPGSGQGSSQPYSAQNRAEGRKGAPPASDGPAGDPAGTAPPRGLFA